MVTSGNQTFDHNRQFENQTLIGVERKISIGM